MVAIAKKGHFGVEVHKGSSATILRPRFLD